MLPKHMCNPYTIARYGSFTFYQTSHNFPVYLGLPDQVTRGIHYWYFHILPFSNSRSSKTRTRANCFGDSCAATTLTTCDVELLYTIFRRSQTKNPNFFENFLRRVVKPVRRLRTYYTIFRPGVKRFFRLFRGFFCHIKSTKPIRSAYNVIFFALKFHF